MRFDQESALALLLGKRAKRTQLVGFFLGATCGPIGVGVFLWSLLDFLLSFALCSVIFGWDFPYPLITGWFLCGVWNLVRMKRCTPQQKSGASLSVTRPESA